VYKNILCLVTKKEQEIIQVLKKHKFKVDFISPEISFQELADLVYKKNYEILLISGYVDRSKRSQIHSFMFKNFPYMLYVEVIYEIRQMCTIETCPLLRKDLCQCVYINYLDDATFITFLNHTIKKHTSILQGKLLKIILEMIEKVILKHQSYAPLKQDAFLDKQLRLENINNLIKYTFNLATKKFISMFNPDKISIFLYNNNSEKYELISSYGFKNGSSQPITIQKDCQLINLALEKQKSFLLHDGLKQYKQLKNIPTKKGVTSSMILPLSVGGTSVGIICLSRILPNKKMFLNQEFFVAKKFAQWLSYLYSIILSNKLIVEYEIMKTNFISAINHEIRTPLMTISSATELAIKTLPKEIYSLIQRNVKRLNDLADHLLDYSRIDRHTFTITKTANSVYSTIQEIMSEYNLILKDEDIKLNLIFEVKNDVQYFDKDRIKQVISNLINNSIKFIPKEKTDKLIELSVNETEE
jgi:hypothetical protein